MNRIAVISLIVSERSAVEPLNALLHDYADNIIGRMGIPVRQRGVNLISVALDAPQETVSALAGKLGRLRGVTSKTVYAPEGL